MAKRYQSSEIEKSLEVFWVRNADILKYSLDEQSRKRQVDAYQIWLLELAQFPNCDRLCPLCKNRHATHRVALGPDQWLPSNKNGKNYDNSDAIEWHERSKL